MKLSSVVLSVLLSLTFTNSGLASGISSEEAQDFVQKTLNPSKKSRDASDKFDTLLDSAAWAQNSMQFFDARTSHEKTQIYGAVRAYYVNAIRSMTQLPTVIRNGKVNSILAQMFLSDEEAAKIINSPITSKILWVKSEGDISRVRVQLLPEHTAIDDQTAQVQIFVKKSGDSYKITEIESNGVRFVKLYTLQVKLLGRNVSTAIETLVNKNLIRRSQIEEYSRMK
ncbi:MAG: hypothetical protein AB7O96_09440 [Pseudobdellovibrionaceae bacterium]